MTKGQIHFSNNLENLAALLKKNLFFNGSSPFEKRLCVVPHLGLKEWITYFLAKDPVLQVAAGVEIVNFPQGFAKILGASPPKVLELSLAIEHELLPIIDQYPLLQNYFGQEEKMGRIGSFCDALATYFLRYTLFGRPKMPDWQEFLWQRVMSSFIFPTQDALRTTTWKIHLFGFFFLPKKYLQLFDQEDVSMYLFSPCEMFWGDFYTEKERVWIERSMTLDLFESTPAEQNLLLANWGSVGRALHIMVEDLSFQTQEHYYKPSQHTALAQLQTSLLEGEQRNIQADGSIYLCSGASPLRELEHLRDYLLTLFKVGSIEPKDVQVVAPDISLYYPYIKTVFEDIYYTVADVSMNQIDPVAKAFALLLQLPKKRFDVETFFQLLECPPFCERWELEPETIRQWLEKSNIRWGASAQQREQLLHNEGIEPDGTIASSGTWADGLRRLLLGLGDGEGEGAPLPLIGVTQMQQFNTLYTLLRDLEEDLAPMIDGTCWPIPLWIRYFSVLLESYLAIDPTHGLYKELRQYAFATSRLDAHEVPYEAIERVVEQIIGQKTKIDASSHLQALRFCSASQGAVLPAKVVCFIGMDEDVFPKKEEANSLYLGEVDVAPKATELDKYVWLQSMHSAKEYFYASFVRDSVGKRGPSLLLDELMRSLTGLSIVHYPAPVSDPVFFDGTYPSYQPAHYAMAVGKQAPHAPLIEGFYHKIQLSSDPKEQTISPKQLLQFASNPLRYFFHQVLAIYPEKEFSSQPEFLLPPLVRSQLVQQALCNKPLDQVLKEAQATSQLPLQIMQPLAQEQIERDLSLWQEALQAFGLEPQQMQTQQVELRVEPFILQGKCERVTPKGMFVWGKDCLEDRIRFWPAGLLMQQQGLPLIFVKDQKEWMCEGSLAEYLCYFHTANTHCSPLLPALAGTLLEKGMQEGRKAIDALEDPFLGFLEFRDGPICLESLYANWAPYLQEVFGGIYESIPIF